jgi:hypothetical protein
MPKSLRATNRGTRVMMTLVLAALTGPCLAAQAPAQIAGGVPAFVDSVRRVSDTAALARDLEVVKHERATAPTSRDRAWRESRQGWLDLRLGELGEGRARLDEAIAHFDEAIYRDKRLADPWVGLAEA